MNRRRVGAVVKVGAAVLLLAAFGCTLSSGPPPITPTPTASVTPRDVGGGTLEAMQTTGTAAQAHIETLEATGTADVLEKRTPTATATVTATVGAGQATKAGPPAATTQPPPTVTPTLGLLIRSFEAVPGEIDPGESVTLTWETVGESARLCYKGSKWSPGLDWCRDVALSGSEVISIDAWERNYVAFVLFAVQGDLEENVTAGVTLRCPDVWFFENPPDVCPGEPATISAGAAQRFEHGLMVWVKGLGQIFVMFDDGRNPAWLQGDDPWVPGMLEDDPDINPPEGFYEPVRGFGMVWREDVGAFWDVRERLGWAVGQEFAMETAFQRDSAAKYITGYLRGPDGVLVLEAMGYRWSIWEGPE